MLAELFNRYSFYPLGTRSSFRVITESHLLPAITPRADYITIITTIDYRFIEVVNGHWNRFTVDSGALPRTVTPLSLIDCFYGFDVSFSSAGLCKLSMHRVSHSSNNNRGVDNCWIKFTIASCTRIACKHIFTLLRVSRARDLWILLDRFGKGKEIFGMNNTCILIYEENSMENQDSQIVAHLTEYEFDVNYFCHRLFYLKTHYNYPACYAIALIQSACYYMKCVCIQMLCNSRTAIRLDRFLFTREERGITR